MTYTQAAVERAVKVHELRVFDEHLVVPVPLPSGPADEQVVTPPTFIAYTRRKFPLTAGKHAAYIASRTLRGGTAGHQPVMEVTEEADAMILDMHAHVGRPNYALRVPEFSNEDLAARMKASNVSQCCVFSFYDVTDNEYVAKACEGRDDLIPFAFINPKEPNAAQQLETLFARRGFRGLKLHPFAHGFHLNNFKIVDPLFALCEQFRAPIICHGLADNAYNTVYAFAEMAGRFPRVNLVMAHGAFMWGSREAIRASHAHPNLYIETTCISPQTIADGIDDIGAEKYVFGSDVPWADFDVEILKVRKAVRKDRDLELVLGGNLARLLRPTP
jgi:predicted TIM-barrel fold metal-dependent hydrolase